MSAKPCQPLRVNTQQSGSSPAQNHSRGRKCPSRNAWHEVNSGRARDARITSFLLSHPSPPGLPSGPRTIVLPELRHACRCFSPSWGCAHNGAGRLGSECLPLLPHPSSRPVRGTACRGDGGGGGQRPCVLPSGCEPSRVPDWGLQCQAQPERDEIDALETPHFGCLACYSLMIRPGDFPCAN